MREYVLKKENDIDELESMSTRASISLQEFHKQQQELFDEFVVLRNKYDEVKVQFSTCLWSHCVTHHPEMKSIPPMEDHLIFEESTEQVGSYTIGCVLGEGQFATVKRCRKRETPLSSRSHDGNPPGDREGQPREYAIKIINKDRISTINSIRRMSNEVDILGKLRSKWVIDLKDVIHSKDFLYLITEVGGSDLFEFFDDHPEGVSEDWAKKIVYQILKAVSHCHMNAYCHRDLKPENILMEFDVTTNECLDLKLCDFGLATKFSSNEKLTEFCGSPGFFAPEMILTGAYYGDKADIWSIGCIILELLLGHDMFCDNWMVSLSSLMLLYYVSFSIAVYLLLPCLHLPHLIVSYHDPIPSAGHDQFAFHYCQRWHTTTKFCRKK